MPPKPGTKHILEGYTPEPNTGCWLWMGAPTNKGYGQTTFMGKKNVFVHRASYFLHKGEIPAGMCVLHHCDTPACINPDHLYLGTKSDNSLDCVRRKRHFLTKYWSQRTHCKHGHEFTPENVRKHKRNNSRICIACTRERWASRKAVA
jgi:hypothetical protein